MLLTFLSCFMSPCLHSNFLKCSPSPNKATRKAYAPHWLMSTLGDWPRAAGSFSMGQCQWFLATRQADSTSAVNVGSWPKDKFCFGLETIHLKWLNGKLANIFRNKKVSFFKHNGCLASSHVYNFHLFASGHAQIVVFVFIPAALFVV